MTNKFFALAALFTSAFSAFAQNTSPAPFSWQTKISAPIQTYGGAFVDNFSQASPRYIEPLPGDKWRVYHGAFAQVLDANGAPGPIVQTSSAYGSALSEYVPVPETTLMPDGGTASVDGPDLFDRYDSSVFTQAISPVNPRSFRGNCAVRRHHPNGDLAWRTQLGDLEFEGCTGVLAVQEQVWAIAEGSVYRFAADGARLGKTRLGVIGRTMLWRDSAADLDGAYFVGSAQINDVEAAQSPLLKSVIVRLNELGVEQWRFSANSTERYRLAIKLPDGVVFASELTSNQTNGEFELIKLDRTGVERFRRRMPGKILALALDPNGAYRALIQANSNTLALTYFDARGLTTNRREIAANPGTEAIFEFAGNSLLICDRLNATVFDRSGLARAELVSEHPQTFQGHKTCRARLSQNGEVLLGPKRKSCSDRDCFELVRVELNNSAQSRWPVRDRRIRDRLLAASFEVQGGLLVASQVDRQFEIRFIDALGAVRWQRNVESSPRYIPEIVVNEQIYCVIDRPALVESPKLAQCYGIANNAFRFSVALPTPSTSVVLLSDRFLLDEGQQFETSSRIKALDFQGNVIFLVNEPGSFNVTVSGIYGFNAQSFVRWDTRGQLVSRHALARNSGVIIKLLDDGILVWNNGTVSRLALDGSVRWQSNAGVDSESLDKLEQIGDRVVLVFENSEPARNLMAGTVQIFSAQNGTQLASHTIEVTDTRIVKTAIASAPSDRITIVGTDARYAEVRYVLDAQSGSLLDVQSGDLGLARALAVNADFNRFPVSTDNFLIRTMTNEFAETEMLVAKRQFTVRENLPVGNPSLIGAWYNPQMPGQGFFIQRLGDVQFLTWFFSRPDFEINPARLSWLSLQGSAVGTSKLAELKIYRSSGGSFVGGSAPLFEVGSARLSFQSCSDATLSYVLAQDIEVSDDLLTGNSRNPRDFPPERGVIALTSLLPATGCAAPLSTPAPISTKTGLFSDPQVAGQGIMSVENQGQLFAGWFTFDPAGASNDSYSHSWFTLQGSTTPGAQTVQTQIYRTIGTIRNRSQRGSQMVVGSAEFDFQDCKNVTVNYRFIDGEAALAMRGKSGTARLTRNGDCPSR